MIYEEVLSEGHISITRASKALHENTKLALQEHGTFRARIYHHDGKTFALVPQLQSAHVYDAWYLDLRIIATRPEGNVLGPEWKEENLVDLVRRIMFAIRDPRHCTLWIDMSVHDSIDREHKAVFTFLGGFRRINVMVCILPFP